MVHTLVLLKYLNYVWQTKVEDAYMNDNENLAKFNTIVRLYVAGVISWIVILVTLVATAPNYYVNQMLGFRGTSEPWAFIKWMIIPPCIVLIILLSFIWAIKPDYFSILREKTGIDLSENYFSRHWHGKLTLPISFWINYVLLNLFIKVYFLASMHVSTYSNLSTLNFWSLICYWFVILPWQIIGLWRSCNYHEQKNPTSEWPKVVQGLIIINVVLEISYSFYLLKFILNYLR
jgi:hypothetical protein